MPRTPSNLPYLIASGLALLVILLAWTGRDRFETVGIGSEAPHFEVVTLDGEPVTIRDYEGRVVLLNLWATWCPPCVWEMPSMERLYQMVDDEDFDIVALSLDGRRGQMGPMGRMAGDPRAFADSLGLTFTILHDPDGKTFRSYQAAGVPESFVIGRDGKIYRKVSGPTEWDHPEYVDFIRRLLERGT